MAKDKPFWEDESDIYCTYCGSNRVYSDHELGSVGDYYCPSCKTALMSDEIEFEKPKKKAKKNPPMSRSQMKKNLSKKFPHMEMSDSEYITGEKGAIVTGEGSWVDDPTYGEIDMFNYNAWEFDPQEEIWILGTYKPLEEFLVEHGWWAETQDPGTWVLRPWKD